MATAASALTVREYADTIHEIVKTNIIVAFVRFDLHGKIGLPFVEMMYALGPNDTRVPDVSFRLNSEIPVPATRDYLAAPSLAIEVVSSENASDLMDRVEDHFRGGSRTVWIVYPDSRAVMTHEADGKGRLLHDLDNLTLPWLPELSIPVAELFIRL